MDKQLQRDESPISSFSSVDLAQVERAVDLVRRRLRLQAAVQGLVFGLIAAATVMLLALSLYRFGVLSRSGLRTVTYCFCALSLRISSSNFCCSRSISDRSLRASFWYSGR